MFFGLVTKHACDGRTDGRTDKENYDSQDRASIAASRGNDWKLNLLFMSRVGYTVHKRPSPTPYMF